MCMQKDPNVRLSSETLINHPNFSSKARQLGLEVENKYVSSSQN